jgi:hypothetical protein
LNHWGLMDENGCGLADTVLLETEWIELDNPFRLGIENLDHHTSIIAINSIRTRDWVYQQVYNEKVYRQQRSQPEAE